MESKKRTHIIEDIERVISNNKIDNMNSYTRPLNDLIEDLKIYQHELESQNDELRRIYNELEYSQKEYIELFENAPLGYVIIDKNLNIIKCNQTFRNMINGPRQTGECQSKMDFRNFISADTQDIFHIFTYNLLAENKPKEAEITIKLPENGKIYVEMTGRIFIQNQDKRIFLSFKDITDKKETEKLLDNFFMINLDLMCIADIDGNFLKINKEWENVLGLTTEEILEKKYLDFVHPDDIPASVDAMKKIEKGKQIRGFINRYRTREGSYRAIEWRAQPKGKLIYAAARDITEQKQIEEVRKQLELAKKTLQFKQNFLANMSHEMRTPLTGIMGMIEILGQTEPTYQQKDYLHTLKVSVQHLREIIDQVLDFSRLEAGKSKLKLSVFELDTIITDAVNLHKSRLKAGLKMIKNHDINIPIFIKTDKVRITQIINNLLSNAVKFTTQGTVTISTKLVAIDHLQEQCTIKIEVTDTGPGISDTEKLFTPFTQIEMDDTREHDGTGLGLAISKELALLLGGEMDVISEPGKGSTFWFTFNAGIALKPVDTESENQESAQLKALNILLAEDKLINQKVVTIMLTSMGHNVTIASNGLDVLEIFKPNHFHLILMDIQMPMMDGVTATQKLKEQYENLPPIVGLSANAFEGDREKYMALGMDEYLTKPVKKEDFLTFIPPIMATQKK